MSSGKWSDVTRSNEYWNWRASLDRFLITPTKFNNFLSQLIEKEKTMTPEVKKFAIEEDDETVDMDDVSKSQEVSEESEIEEEPDKEPDSEIEDEVTDETKQ